MSFKIIQSGRSATQLITEDGFRYHINRKAQGPKLTAYYECVKRGCPARAATTGSPDDGTIRLKYHNQPKKPHNHAADLASNDAQEILSNFRSAAHENPERPVKATWEEVVATKGAEGLQPSVRRLRLRRGGEPQGRQKPQDPAAAP